MADGANTVESELWNLQSEKCAIVDKAKNRDGSSKSALIIVWFEMC